MEKEFNDVGACIPGQHYMVDTSEKIEAIIRLVEKNKYFTINRPRQFGKTTTLSLLAKQLNLREDYVALNISFEDIDTDTYQQQKRFIVTFMEMLGREFEFLGLPEPARYTEQQLGQIINMPHLSSFIATLVRDHLSEKAPVLLIDEADKSSNNRLFLDFLGMLRKKYLLRNEGKDHSFRSVILTGVHDIKTLKAKIRVDEETKYNSPWNIAVDFEVDLSFAACEIETMLQDYSQEKNIRPDIPAITEKLYYYTSGYPYLVSKLCKFIDEKIVSEREDKNWSVSDVEAAFTMIVNKGYTTTLFDSMIKNLENNKDMHKLVSEVIINGKHFDFTIANPVINIGHLYGIIIQSEHGRCHIHNRIFEQRIYDYMMSELLQTKYSETSRKSNLLNYNQNIVSDSEFQSFSATTLRNHILP